MLSTLNIRNFVIVEKLELDFQNGFSALTGETGAGKSILIDAIQLLFGSRSDAGLIREGADKSDLSASFTTNEKIREWLAENDFTGEEDDLILRRTLDIKGKSRAWINGIPASLSQLKELSQMLVVIHGQHAHQSLLRKGSQLEMLDDYAGLRPTISELKKRWNAWRDALEALDEAKNRQAQHQAEAQQLSWYLEDMDELAPLKGEWDTLNEEHTKLSRYTEILEACERARATLTEADESALSMVDSAISTLDDISDIDKKIESVYGQLNEAREIIDSASSDVEHFLSRMDFDEARFAEVDERLSSYLSLARKYHIEPGELYEEMIQSRLKLSELQEINVTELQNKAQKSQQRYEALAAEVSAERSKAALRMQTNITEVMQTLAMEGGSFEVSVTPSEHPGPLGTDSCEFLVAGHAGVARRSLAKVASGGELARVSLAIAVTDTMTATVDTLIFDEVDSGIGGGVAETVGRLLAQLGEHQQVLCVTHLPQVASCASHHFKIVKHAESKDEAPTSTVIPLDEEERVKEIARMLGGIKITDKTLEHAKEMLRH